MAKTRRDTTPSPFIPRLHKDEALFSYVARTWQLSCQLSEEAFLSRLFDGEHRSVGDVTGESAESAAKLERGLARISPNLRGTLHKEHSLHVLADPFRFPDTSLGPRNRLAPHEQRVFGDSKGIAATPFRTSPAFCPECLKEDVGQLGYGYWRRKHQLCGVKLCPTHQSALIDLCLHCGTEHSPYNVPTKECRSCGHQLTARPVFDNARQQQFHIRFAETVAAVYDGAIRGPLQNDAVIAHFESIHDKSSVVPGQELFSYIRELIGDDYLTEQGLQYEPNVKFQWPTLFYASRFIMGEATAQLVLYSAITLDEPRPELFLDEMPTGPEWTVSDRREVGLETLWSELSQRSSPGAGQPPSNQSRT